MDEFSLIACNLAVNYRQVLVLMKAFHQRISSLFGDAGVSLLPAECVVTVSLSEALCFDDF